MFLLSSGMYVPGYEDSDLCWSDLEYRQQSQGLTFVSFTPVGAIVSRRFQWEQINSHSKEDRIQKAALTNACEH